jgi:hypothetical protein
VVGNCQARPVANILERLYLELDIRKIAVVHLLNDADSLLYSDFLDNADVIITQNIADTNPCSFLRTNRLKEKYGDKVVVILNLYFEGYNPDWFYIRVPNKSTLSGPMGDYHNKVIYTCWENNSAVSTVVKLLNDKEFNELNFKPVIEKSLSALSHREVDVDIKICDYINEKYTSKRLFHTFNHPTLELLVKYVNRIGEFLGLKQDGKLPLNLSEPLDQFIPVINKVFDSLHDGKNFHKGQVVESIKDTEIKLSTLCNYSTESLVEEFYLIYDENETLLRSLEGLVDNINYLACEPGNPKQKQTSGFSLTKYTSKLEVATEQEADKLLVVVKSNPNMTISTENYFDVKILPNDLRTNLKFVLAFIYNLINNRKYDLVLKQIENIIVHLNFPFVASTIFEIIFYNILSLKKTGNNKLLTVIITRLTVTPICLNKLKLCNFDSPVKYNLFRKSIKSYIDQSSTNETAILFNSYLAYNDSFDYYQNNFYKVLFRIGINDENYLACYLKLFEKFGQKFKESLVTGLIKSGRLSIAIIIDKHKPGNRLGSNIDNLIIDQSLDLVIFKKLQSLESNQEKNNQIKTLGASNKPRVAVCISGQLRGYKAAFHSINELLSQLFDFDVYISTWSDVGCREPFPLVAANRVFNGEFLDSFKSVISNGLISWEDFKVQYPSLMALIHSDNEVDKDFIYKSFDKANKVILDIQNESDVNLPTNQHKMFYKIERAFELVESQDLKYDFVIRMRPDRAISLKVGIDEAFEQFNLCNNNQMLVDMSFMLHPFKGFVIGDTFALSDFNMMNHYAKFYSEGRYKPDYIRPHNDLAFHLFAKNIEINDSPFSFSSFLNPLLNDDDICTAIINDSNHRDFKVDKILLKSFEDLLTKKILI